MRPAELLAKSPYGERRLSLARHCGDTEEAAQAIFREDGRWARSWARFFRFSESDRQRFLLNLRVAALFHDLGKANADFQAAVLGTAGGRPQTLRHEHISALVLCLPEIRGWLAQSPLLDVDAITAAVLSHHLKAAESGTARVWGEPQTTRDQARILMHLDHPEVAQIFERVRVCVGLGAPPPIPTGPWVETTGIWKDSLSRGRDAARKFGREIRRQGSTRQALLMAVKAGVIVADSVASAIVRVGGSIGDWIEDVVHRPAITASELASAIIEPRVAAIEGITKKPFNLHRFQALAAEQGERALLLAGCGAGKTLAAWKWAEAVLKERELGRVIFLYPTRGTATEGFRDYVGWAPEADAALVHGTSKYELEQMAKNPNEAIRDKKYLDEADARLFSLGLWSKRYFSATVDQFLGFLEHSYGGLCLLPVLADSAIILDEVHSYDRKMFSDLVSFLERFDASVLCMTATLPPGRREALVEKGLRVFPDEHHRAELADLEEQEGRPRYLLRELAGMDAGLAEAVAAYRNGQKVLWVVNTVDRCQTAARALSDEVEGVMVYHSRFRLCDRQAAHAAVVDAFKGERPAIAVTTQVCEMSLDLDADVLITELAPVPSLVQRFGRSNRSSKRDPSFRAQVLWYAPPNFLPYGAKELAVARHFLVGFGEAAMSQRQLAEGLEIHAIDEVQPDASALFLTSGYYATPGSLRDTDEHSQAAILDQDLAEYSAKKRAKQPTDGLELPAPRRLVLKDAEDAALRTRELAKFVGIVPGRMYDSKFGLRTRLEEP
jgi:CRISPR-associated endonuclease/helicase Cas3